MESEKEKLNSGAKKEFSATEAIIGKDLRPIKCRFESANQKKGFKHSFKS